MDSENPRRRKTLRSIGTCDLDSAPVVRPVQLLLMLRYSLLEFPKKTPCMQARRFHQGTKLRYEVDFSCELTDTKIPWGWCWCRDDLSASPWLALARAQMKLLWGRRGLDDLRRDAGTLLLPSWPLRSKQIRGIHADATLSM